jgi:predicted nucleotidyltransferase
MSVKQLTESNWGRLAAELGGHASVIAARGYGSAQEGTVRPGSDIDVGVLFDGRPSLDELVDLRAALQEVLQYEEIDLVVLNDASPVLRFAAVSGRPVYVADRERRAGFVSLTAREYEDEMAQWRRALALHG